MEDRITLSRDCPAIEIPSGWPVELKAGEVVLVTQSLGGSFTVLLEDGRLARIAGEHAEVLGRANQGLAKTSGEGTLEEQVWDALHTVYDPEIPVDIVELGLIYGCQLTPVDGGNRVDIRMTMTAPGCGMGDIIKAEVEDKVAALEGVKEVRVEIVLDPPWDPSLMSEAARLETGIW